MKTSDAPHKMETSVPIGNIDSINVNILPISGRKVICGEIDISGWIVDLRSRNIFKQVVVSLDGVELNAEYGLSRHDIAFHFNNPNYYRSGFRLRRSTSDLKEGEYSLTVRAYNEKVGECYELVYQDKVIIRNSGLFARLMSLKQRVWQLMRNKILFLRGFIWAVWFPVSFLKNVVVLLISLLFLRKEVMVISLVEHIGDIVACEPVTRMLRSVHPKAHVVWITKYAYISLVSHNPGIDQTLGVTCIYEWNLLKKLKLPFQIFDLHIDQKPCTTFNIALENANDQGITLENYYSHGNILAVFLAATGLPKMDMAPEFHFEEKIMVSVPKNLVVLHTSSNEIYRNWQPEKWSDLVQRLICDGYFVAEVGLSSCVIPVHDKFLNYCGKLSLQEIAMLIKKADLFIGIDSGFAHFANAVNTPGVILLGYYRAFKKYMPYSGRYKSGANATVIQYDGYAKDIPVELVHTSAMERLQHRGCR